jgi:hypothetical protein
MNKKRYGGRDRSSGVESLRPWPEVRKLWNQRSGESISRERVQQIAKRAMNKLRRLSAEQHSRFEP